MKAKIFLKCMIAAVVMVTLAACEGGNTPEKIDQRDAFVGAYDYVATGNVVLQTSFTPVTIPLNDKGTFTISKVGDKDQIVIVGYNDSINATVSGNQLVLETNTYNTTLSSIEVQLTFNYDKATLTGNQLTWNSDVYGTGTYNAISASGTGTVSVVATKKQ